VDELLSSPERKDMLPTHYGPLGGGEPLPEAILWILLTGQVPTVEQTRSLTLELSQRATIPPHVEMFIRSLPKNMDPMTQLSMGVLACQPDSKFVAAYKKGVRKHEYWEYALEDVLDIIAKLPSIAALIYRCTLKDGVVKKDTSGKLDYSAQFNRMLGYDSPYFDEMMRLFLVTHSDHEGGSTSAHATHLVGSTLSDPYLSISAGLNALAGPLHGLANQEVLSWIQQLQTKFNAEGKEVNKETITAFAWETLKAGKDIPGYSQGVLPMVDPRFECQRQFALDCLPNDPLFEIANTFYDVMPGVLTEHGKTKNPYPNVDSHSGVLLWLYGFKDCSYYTVLFGVSRAMGALSQVFWDRALGMRLESIKSVDHDFIVKHFANK
jgi:citrate synthase